ncbi:hypothetical protein PanWU01x14_229880, partial [Parasponia andersonii]
MAVGRISFALTSTASTLEKLEPYLESGKVKAAVGGISSHFALSLVQNFHR